MDTAEEDEYLVVVQMEDSNSIVEDITAHDERAPEQQTTECDESTDDKLVTVIVTEEESNLENSNADHHALRSKGTEEATDKYPASATNCDKEQANTNNIEENSINAGTSWQNTPRVETNKIDKNKTPDVVNDATEETLLPGYSYKKRKVELFTDIKGPEWYNVKGNLVTRSILAKNLTNQFEFLPIFGRPENGDVEEFHKEKLKEFIGSDINDEEFEELSKYCSPDNLKTGQELVVHSTMPSQGYLSADDATQLDNVKANLCILKKCRMRIEKDKANNYSTKLKYRGVRLIPLNQEEDRDVMPSVSEDVMLEPGKDILFRLRLYRPYHYQITRERFTRGRHSVFSCDMVAAGRLRLSGVRDRIVCTNDLDMRLDASLAPNSLPETTAKEVFPSGFLFINNTFYVDTRPGCKDHSRVIREWAARRGLGEFPVKDMNAVRLEDVAVRLGYPEVYVHQGNCEHVFTFSEVRLLSAADPARLAAYPRHSAVSQHQTVYCTTCAEFGAKWVVVGCPRVPFDPAFFCDTCFKQYLYIDGVKIGEFKAYAYRGNETNTLKPC